MPNSTSFSLNAAAWFFVGQDEENGSPRSVAIRSPFRIGRRADCDLSLPSQSVSGNHAKIVDEDGELWLYDLGSTNGTFVNGERVHDRVALQDGDAVQFAAIVFQLSHSSESPEVRTSGHAHAGAVETLQSLQFERLFNGGVVPFFQPIVRIDSNQRQVAGLEVLGRSRIFGLRTPAQMFAVASRLEMEAELSRVLRRQGIELAQRDLPENIAIFVNTHPAELQCEGLLGSLQDTRETCQGRPITLEVCESVLNDTKQIIELRSALIELDIKLAFDNFGAGQSRLFALSEVTPDVIKFDHKLIKDIDKAPAKRQQFVAALVQMVVNLGVTPVAECVEGRDEHDTLRQLGFQMAQGFYYGKPTSLPDCLDWLTRHASPARGVQIEDGPMIQSFLSDQRSLEISVKPYHDADWLLQQPASHYTIQVLSAISLERAESYVAKQERPQDFAVFCKPGKTRMLYIVVYGVFENREAAKEATVRLSSLAVSPWIRMLSGVQTEIRGKSG